MCNAYEGCASTAVEQLDESGEYRITFGDADDRKTHWGFKTAFIGGHPGEMVWVDFYSARKSDTEGRYTVYGYLAADEAEALALALLDAVRASRKKLTTKD